jgi:hypothetical protein
MRHWRIFGKNKIRFYFVGGFITLPLCGEGTESAARSQHDAIRKYREYVQSGLRYVIDIDALSATQTTVSSLSQASVQGTK